MSTVTERDLAAWQMLAEEYTGRIALGATDWPRIVKALIAEVRSAQADFEALNRVANQVVEIANKQQDAAKHLFVDPSMVSALRLGGA